MKKEIEQRISNLEYDRKMSTLDENKEISVINTKYRQYREDVDNELYFLKDLLKKAD